MLCILWRAVAACGNLWRDAVAPLKKISCLAAWLPGSLAVCLPGCLPACLPAVLCCAWAGGRGAQGPGLRGEGGGGGLGAVLCCAWAGGDHREGQGGGEQLRDSVAMQLS